MSTKIVHEITSHGGNTSNLDKYCVDGGKIIVKR